MLCSTVPREAKYLEAGEKGDQEAFPSTTRQSLPAEEIFQSILAVLIIWSPPPH